MAGSTEELRSENSNQESRSEEHSNDDDPSDSESDISKSDNVEAKNDINSNIDSSNIIKEKRTRTHTKQPNIDSFAGKRYQVNFLNIKDEEFKQFETIKAGLYAKTVGTCFTQMTANKGMKLLGEIAVASMFKEYKQLDDLEVLGILNPDMLTHEQKRDALRAINLIKIKRDGNVKGRTCADGSSQRKYVPREEATSPTIALKSIMALLLINAYEERDVAIFDVPGAYLHADVPKTKFAILKIEGKFADIMCNVNPEYTQSIRYENGKKV